MKKTGLAAISKRTEELWYRVNKMYGVHTYTLGVNGLNQVVLSKGYTKKIALGNGAVQAALRELLNAGE